jgi:hypothetical protein
MRREWIVGKKKGIFVAALNVTKRFFSSCAEYISRI